MQFPHTSSGVSTVSLCLSHTIALHYIHTTSLCLSHIIALHYIHTVIALQTIMVVCVAADELVLQVMRRHY